MNYCWFSHFFIQISVTLATSHYPGEFKTHHSHATSAKPKVACRAVCGGCFPAVTTPAWHAAGTQTVYIQLILCLQ